MQAQIIDLVDRTAGDDGHRASSGSPTTSASSPASPTRSLSCTAGACVEQAPVDDAPRRPVAPLHPGAAGRPPARSVDAGAARRVPGSPPQPARPAAGMRLLTRAARRGPTRAARPSCRRSPQVGPSTWPAPSAPTPRRGARGSARERGVARRGRAVGSCTSGSRCAPRRASAGCTPSTASSSTITRGETLGLVGESGCGKSTPGRRCCGWLTRPPEPSASSARTSPRWPRRRPAGAAPSAWRWCSRTRCRRSTRGAPSRDVAEPMEVHRLRDGTGRARPRAELLELVGLDPPTPRPASARVLRRPAAAGRHRPGAGRRART